MLHQGKAMRKTILLAVAISTSQNMLPTVARDITSDTTFPHPGVRRIAVDTHKNGIAKDSTPPSNTPPASAAGPTRSNSTLPASAATDSTRSNSTLPASAATDSTPTSSTSPASAAGPTRSSSTLPASAATDSTPSSRATPASAGAEPPPSSTPSSPASPIPGSPSTGAATESSPPSSPVAATATKINVKIVYVNLALVKSRFPDSIAAQHCRLSSQDTLRKAVAAGNAELEKMEAQNKTKTEIEERSKSLKTEVHAMQEALIELTQAQEVSANKKIGAAGDDIMEAASAQLLLDGAGIYAGGQAVIENGKDLTAKLSQRLGTAGLSEPSNSGSPKAYSVAIGYFNLGKIKATPKFAAIDSYRVECENKLRQKVDEGNVNLKSAQNAGKPKSEIEQMTKDLQVSVNQQQQNLLGDVKNRTEATSKELATAAIQIAQSMGLGLIVTNECVIAGGNLIKNNGVDVTESLLKRFK